MSVASLRDVGQTPLRDLVQTKRWLLDVNANETVAQALAALHEGGVLSMPVYAAPGAWLGAGGSNCVVGQKQFIGVVSILDLVAFMLRNATSVDHNSLDETKFEAALQRGVAHVIGSTNESLSLWTEQPDTPLIDVLEEMSRGVHRVLVLPTEPEGLCRILTQSDVVSFVAQNRCPELDALWKLPVKAIAQQGVLAISERDRLVSALEKMLQHSHSAMPVCDASGRVVSTLSASDLRGVYKAGLATLVGLSVGTFIDRVYGHMPDSIVCTEEEPILVALQRMMTHHIHRIWVVAPETRQPLGVLSFSDIIGQIFNVVSA